ncbi:membrane-anchored ubiquitin-fold protein 2-like isoform X2 [Primulina huaijiensis]|uniref:membrane-anchored ubiquitin-fold protein 2-like isoform X2 n=1 Tax=Primulina huaijiensis TaxID=1492673 RepID=UPI003CC78F36
MWMAFIILQGEEILVIEWIPDCFCGRDLNILLNSSSGIILKMSAVKDQLEIKFRLNDGSDIGPKNFAVATSVATLKENVIAQWPKEKQNGPHTVKDVKLICAGRILENNKTVGECMSPLCDIPGAATTMHVVVQPPPEKVKKLPSEPMHKCLCVIL